MGRQAVFLMESFGGSGAYLVPFLLFGVTAFLVSNKHNRIAYWKSGAAVICFLILCGLFELISDAGGTVGGSLADILSPASAAGRTYVILIIMMIIGIVIITGRSVLKGVRSRAIALIHMQKSPIPEGARHLQDAEKNDAQPEKKKNWNRLKQKRRLHQREKTVTWREYLLIQH